MESESNCSQEFIGFNSEDIRTAQTNYNLIKSHYDIINESSSPKNTLDISFTSGEDLDSDFSESVEAPNDIDNLLHSLQNESPLPSTSSSPTPRRQENQKGPHDVHVQDHLSQDPLVRVPESNEDINEEEYASDDIDSNSVSSTRSRDSASISDYETDHDDSQINQDSDSDNSLLNDSIAHSQSESEAEDDNGDEDFVDTNNIYGLPGEGDDLYDVLNQEITWTQDFKPIRLHNFTEPTGPNLPANFDTSTAQPVDYFKLFFTDEIFDEITKNSNAYQAYCTSRKQITNPNYIDKKWTPVEVNEMKAFFGLSIVMGLVSVPRYRNFWSNDPFLSNQGVKQVMTVNRYEKISEYLHISDRESEVGRQNADKLIKIRPLLDSLMESFPRYMHCSRDQSIDEGKSTTIIN